MTVVHMDGALRDGQTQTNAAGVRVARIVHAKERLENLREGFRWNARTIIANRNGGIPLRGVQRDFDRASWRSVPYGVSKNVLHGAAQQHRISQQLDLTRSRGDQAAIPGRGLDFAILDKFVHQSIERHELQLRALRSPSSRVTCKRLWAKSVSRSISLFTRMAAASRSGEVRANSAAKLSRAKGERSSWEMSCKSRRSAVRSFSIRSAI